MIKNLGKYCEENKKKLFDKTPVTFIINLSDKNWELDIQYFMDFYLQNLPKKLDNGKRSINIKKKYRNINADKTYRLNSYYNNLLNKHKPELNEVY